MTRRTTLMFASLFLIVSLLLLGGLTLLTADWVMQIQIVVPPALQPYADWLLGFPGWQAAPELDPVMQPGAHGYRLVTPAF